MTSGGRSPSAFVPVPWRSVTRTTAAGARRVGGSSASRTAVTASALTNGRSIGSTRIGRRAARDDVGPCLGAGPRLRPLERWRRVRAPRSGRAPQDLAVGADDQDVIEPVDGQGGHHGPCQEPLDEIVPLLRIERLAEPRLGAVERADRDDRRDPRPSAGRAANPRTVRARRARPSWSAMIVSVTSVRSPSAAIVRLELRVDLVEHERVDRCPAYIRATPRALDS